MTILYQIISEAIDFEKTLAAYRDKLEARHPKEAEPEEVLNQLVSVLSQHQQKFPLVKWILDRYISGEIKRMEDFGRAAEALEVVSSRSSGTDVNKMSFYELESLAMKIKATPSRKQKRQQERTEVYSEIQVVYDGPEGKVLVPKTEAASKYLGRGTTWCTAGDRDNRFTEYARKGPLYVIMPNDGRKFQFHLQSAQLMDEEDEEVDFREFNREYPWVFGKAIKFTEEVKLAAVNQDGYAIEYIKNPSEKMKLAAVKQNGYAIQFIKDQSEAVKLAAVTQNGYAIQYINDLSEALKLAAVKQNGYAIQYINDQTEGLKLAAVKQDGMAIRYIKDQSEALKLAAVKQNGHAIRYIEDQSEVVELEAVKQNGHAIRYIKDPSEAVKLAAVKQDWGAIQYIKDQSEEVKLTAVKQDGMAIRYIKDQSEALKLAAVKQNGHAIRYIEDQSEEVKLAAVTQNGYAIRYIKDQSEEVRAASEESLKRASRLKQQ